MATATRVKGHALKADGAAFNEMGERLYPKTTSGTGAARCECRELSPEYGTRKERVDWHKAHKLRHAAEAPVTREEAPLDKARKVEFPHAKKWWKALGKDGAQLLLSDFPVKIDFDDTERVLHLSGDGDATASAEEVLDYAWGLALPELKQRERTGGVHAES